jgi:hypothetical protein
MQDPTWHDVLDFLLNRAGHMHWPLWLLAPMFSIVLAAIQWAWQRHVQRQRFDIVASIVKRWIAQNGKPFNEMSTGEQLAAIDRLAREIIGYPAVVLEFLLSLRVFIEPLEPHQSVLIALDELTQTWHDKLPSDRKRRERRAHVLARRDVNRLVHKIEREGDRLASS